MAQRKGVAMIHPAFAAMLLSAGLLAVGCSGDYELVEQSPAQPDDSASESSTAPAAEPPPANPPSPAPVEGTSRDDVPEAGPSQPAERAAAPQTVVTAAADPAKPATSPPAPAPSASESRTPARKRRVAAAAIHLSTGVALAQTLPTGTAMGFSVDYRFIFGQPSPSSPYAWVIVPTKGQPVKQPVRLEREGTLQGFVLQLRPEHGPFETHIEDAQGNQISRTLPLR